MPRRTFQDDVFIMCTCVQLEFLLCLHGGGRETFCSALAFQIGQSALPLPLPWLLLSCFGSSVSAGVTPCHDNYSLHAVQLVCLLPLRLYPGGYLAVLGLWLMQVLCHAMTNSGARFSLFLACTVLGASCLWHV